MRMLPYVLVLGLAIYAFIDLSRSSVSERAGLHPAAWVGIIIVPVLGPGAWLLVSRYQRGALRTPPGARGPSTPPPSAPPRRRPRGAPDDDPDFLRGLGRRGRDDDGPTGR